VNGLQAYSRGTVSQFNAPVARPGANADTITASLAPFPNSGVRGGVYTAASTGIIPDYNESSCFGAGIQNADFAGAIGQVAAKSLLGSIPIIGNALGSLTGIFGAHHAAAVKQEQAILCANVPGIQAFLRSVDAAVAQGADANLAIQAMESAYSAFVSRTAPIFKNCNAACCYRKYVRAAIEFRKLNFALIAAQTSANGQGLIGGVVNAAKDVVSSVSGALVPFFGAAGPGSRLSNVGAPVAVGDPYAGAVAAVGASPVYSSSVLAQAGLTPGRQGSLAVALVVGGLVISAVVILKTLGRK
jgi:hypothetical protein